MEAYSKIGIRKNAKVGQFILKVIIFKRWSNYEICESLSNQGWAFGPGRRSSNGLARFSGCGLRDQALVFRDVRKRAESHRAQLKWGYPDSGSKKSGRAGWPVCPPLFQLQSRRVNFSIWIMYCLLTSVSINCLREFSSLDFNIKFFIMTNKWNSFPMFW